MQETHLTALFFEVLDALGVYDMEFLELLRIFPLGGFGVPSLDLGEPGLLDLTIFSFLPISPKLETSESGSEL